PIDSIDDFLESLVNSTNAADESIQPMGIDMILAALAMRIRCWGPEELKGKTIDLRKANKNLPLSGSALNDAHICVVNTMEPRAFQGQVLPFGARAAVMGFCRERIVLGGPRTILAETVALLNPNGKKTIIFELEALAVFVACLTLLPTEGIFQNDRVVIFVDNEAVLARLVSGRGGGEIGNLIFSGVMNWECEANVLAWYERVPSSANIADAPSRGDVSGLDPSLAIDVLQSLLEVCPSDVKGEVQSDESSSVKK
ncbi:unnamed protein product, partial [Cladocopium goreaui]